MRAEGCYPKMSSSFCDDQEVEVLLVGLRPVICSMFTPRFFMSFFYSLGSFKLVMNSGTSSVTACTICPSFFLIISTTHSKKFLNLFSDLRGSIFLRFRGFIPYCYFVGDLIDGEGTSSAIFEFGTSRAFFMPPPKIDFKSRVVELTLIRCIYFIFF